MLSHQLSQHCILDRNGYGKLPSHPFVSYINRSDVALSVSRFVTAALYSGSIFKGTQTSGRSSYDVTVEFKVRTYRWMSFMVANQCRLGCAACVFALTSLLASMRTTCNELLEIAENILSLLKLKW